MVEFGSNGQVLGLAVKGLTGRYQFLRFSLFAYAIGILGLSACEIIKMSSEAAIEVSPIWFGYMSFGTVAVLGLFTSIAGLFRWTFRAMANLHVLKNPFAKMSSFWAVGWYFIPLANLFKPFQGMVQIWDGSEDASSTYMPGRGRLIWWWGTSIAATLISWISVSLLGWEPVGEDYVMSVYIDLATTAIELASVGCLLIITKQVTDAQTLIQDTGVEAAFA